MSDTPNNDLVICPQCCHQFRAIPVNVQRELAALLAIKEQADAPGWFDPNSHGRGGI